jgi:formylglycine-generating enzyme required for sulfatase activity
VSPGCGGKIRGPTFGEIDAAPAIGALANEDGSGPETSADASASSETVDSTPSSETSVDASSEMADSSPSAEASSVDASEAASPAAPNPAPRCAPGGPGLSDCGPNKESCCASLDVTGGGFYRTYDLSILGENYWVPPDDGGATGLADPAAISSLRLDKYNVTVGRFRQFVNAVSPADGGLGWVPTAASGKHTHLNGGRGLVNVAATGATGAVYEEGWNLSDDSMIAPTNANLACDSTEDLRYATWTDAIGDHENLPINCVTWQEAYAFCIWDGGFLPSEAEWEYAAAGGNNQRTYPWGLTDPGTSSELAIYGCYYPSGPPGFMCGGVANIAPVGSAPLGAGLFGHLDLAGSIYQWNLDWSSDYVNPCTDCANLEGILGRVVRGGDFLEDEATLLAPARNSLNDPTRSRDHGIGFRCARSPN